MARGADPAPAGALALVTGVTDTSAEQAATWAVSGSAPVLLVRDTPELVVSDLSFVLGTSDIDQLDAIHKELTRRGLSKWARVGSGGAECRATPERAGAGRFPAKNWQANGVEALTILGPRSCVMELLSEVRTLRYTPLLALGLEGAEVLHTLGKRGIALGAGNFPSLKPGVDAAPDFYEALGHDAGVLLRAAWAKLGSSPRPTDAAARAAQLAQTLAQVSARLETTDTSGFGGKRRLGRRLSVRQAP